MWLRCWNRWRYLERPAIRTTPSEAGIRRRPQHTVHVLWDSSAGTSIRPTAFTRSSGATFFHRTVLNAFCRGTPLREEPLPRPGTGGEGISVSGVAGDVATSLSIPPPVNRQRLPSSAANRSRLPVWPGFPDRGSSRRKREISVPSSSSIEWYAVAYSRRRTLPSPTALSHPAPSYPRST